MEEGPQDVSAISETARADAKGTATGLLFFGGVSIPKREASDISARSLAHLGDAVFHLFEREREVKLAVTVRQMHVRARVNASTQALLLEKISASLLEDELEIVRRARNVKVIPSRKAQQSIYRRATAFEALLGYLYLTDADRLRTVLALTLALDSDSGDLVV